MSRFIEAAYELLFPHPTTLSIVDSIAIRVMEKLHSPYATVEAEFKIFLPREAPASKRKSLMPYIASYESVRFQGEAPEHFVEVTVPVTSLCPCSKAISERGAHNQRGTISIRALQREGTILWIEDLVETAEACASSPIYTLLKREDEKRVTEMAYDNPKFVEDMVRDVAVALRSDGRIGRLEVTASSEESIHNHQAFASLEFTRP